MSERPSPVEFIKQAGEIERQKENQRRVDNIAVKLVKNSGVMGGDIEEEKEQIVCQEVLGVFGAGYSSVANMEQTAEERNQSSTDRQKKMATENLNVLAKGVFTAMNYSFKYGDSSELITSQLDAEQIDSILPNELKGLGKYVINVDRTATEKDKQSITNFGSVILSNRKKEVDIPEDFIPGKKKGKEDDGDDSGKEGYTRSWEIDPDHMADALKFMAGDLRWSDWTPPAWFKDLEITNPEEAYRISVMAMINEAAAGVAYAGKNLDKIIGNDTVFAFTHEHMSKLFNGDFKLVVSKMFNDLCELEPDQNGRKCLRYKERYYELANNRNRSENELKQLRDEGRVDAVGFLLDKKGGERIVLDDIPSNRGLGIRTIERGVFEKIQHIKGYEDSLADFLAEANGRKEANYMDRMNAYTAWNMFYGFGDSSMADRMRILPTYNNVINDALRTLNPEYKALAKWQILKSGRYKEDKDLFDSEYFSGPLADYVLTIMKTERDLGKPIDGDKTLRQKILDGSMPLLANKTFYGFFDFVHGARDLYRGDFVSAKDQLDGKGTPENFGKGAEVTLASLTMDYGEYNKEGNFVKKVGSKEFNFGNDQVTFMNEFRDMLEGAILTYNCTMGKTEVKDPEVWARTLKDKLGMVNGIEINGTRALSYTSDPELWRDAIIGTFGVDMGRLSSDYIRLKLEIPKGNTAAPAYNLYVNKFLTKILRLSNKDINLNEVMRKLGVTLGNGESAEGFGATVRNKKEWVADGMKTRRLLNRQADAFDRDLSRRSDEIRIIINDFGRINRGNLDSQTSLIYKNLDRAIKSNNEEVIKRLWRELEGRLSRF